MTMRMMKKTTMKKSRLLSKTDRRNLERLRRGIDAADIELVSLLNRRIVSALRIGEIKKKLGIAVYDRAREFKVLDRVRRLNKGPLSDAGARSIYRSIIAACRAHQK